MLSRKDLEFEEKRRTEMFRFVASSSAADRVKAYRDATVEIYKAHNPDKVDLVDTLLAEQYKGQERQMYELICKRYRVKPKSDAEIFRTRSGVNVEPTQPSAADRAKAHRDATIEIYKVHDPGQVKVVDALFVEGWQKGQERELYEKVCKTYDLPVKPESEILGSAEEKVVSLAAKEQMKQLEELQVAARKQESDTLMAQVYEQELIVEVPVQMTQTEITHVPSAFSTPEKVVAQVVNVEFPTP